MLVDGVAEAPGGAHFTACAPDYGRDEEFQKEYAAAAGDPDEWEAFAKRFFARRREYQGRGQAAAERTAGPRCRGSRYPAAGEHAGSDSRGPGIRVTRAESCVIACAEVCRGEARSWSAPSAPSPALGARLAKLTFAPDLVLTDGEAALMAGAPPIGDRHRPCVLEADMPYRSVFDVVWSGRRNMMMMASQIDRTGNQNISAIGPWARPKVQLIGVRGAPGNTVNHPTSYWVPDHRPRTFVEQVDVV